MSQLAVLTNQIAAALTIIGQIAVVIIITALFLRRTQSQVSEQANRVVNFIGHWGLALAFVVAFGAMLTSLFYSEVIGYPPCLLCWYQRIFMYPLVVILGMAIWRKDDDIIDYALAVSGIGAIFGIYHTSLQFGVKSVLPCSVVGVSCAVQYVMEYGYITIPVMSLTAFALVIIFLTMRRIYLKQNK